MIENEVNFEICSQDYYDSLGPKNQDEHTLYFTTDTHRMYRGTILYTMDNIMPATKTSIGGIKVGKNMIISTDGTLSVDDKYMKVEEIANSDSDDEYRLRISYWNGEEHRYESIDTPNLIGPEGRGTRIYTGCDVWEEHVIEPVVGDLYFNYQNNVLYEYIYDEEKSVYTWKQLTCLKGDKGDKGDTGERGTKIFNGTEVSEEGEHSVKGSVSGDYYLNSETFDLFNLEDTSWKKICNTTGNTNYAKKERIMKRLGYFMNISLPKFCAWTNQIWENGKWIVTSDSSKWQEHKFYYDDDYTEYNDLKDGHNEWDFVAFRFPSKANSEYCPLLCQDWDWADSIDDHGLKCPTWSSSENYAAQYYVQSVSNDPITKEHTTASGNNIKVTSDGDLIVVWYPTANDAWINYEDYKNNVENPRTSSEGQWGYVPNITIYWREHNTKIFDIELPPETLFDYGFGDVKKGESGLSVYTINDNASIECATFEKKFFDEGTKGFCAGMNKGTNNTHTLTVNNLSSYDYATLDFDCYWNKGIDGSKLIITGYDDGIEVPMKETKRISEITGSALTISKDVSNIKIHFPATDAKETEFFYDNITMVGYKTIKNPKKPIA